MNTIIDPKEKLEITEVTTINNGCIMYHNANSDRLQLRLKRFAAANTMALAAAFFSGSTMAESLNTNRISDPVGKPLQMQPPETPISIHQEAKLTQSQQPLSLTEQERLLEELDAEIAEDIHLLDEAFELKHKDSPPAHNLK